VYFCFCILDHASVELVCSSPCFTSSLLIKKFSVYCGPGPGGLLPCAKQLATGSCPRQISPARTLQVYVFKIHANVVIASTLISSKCDISFRLSYQKPVSISFPSRACNMLRPSHHAWFECNKNTSWGIKIMTLLITQFSTYCANILS
jgi:hypothetical protein